ncbi:MAG: hypothetical protein P4L51_10500 [Puia sp.]|nr:hypothetical protein [Puia sp.]
MEKNQGSDKFTPQLVNTEKMMPLNSQQYCHRNQNNATSKNGTGQAGLNQSAYANGIVRQNLSPVFCQRHDLVFLKLSNAL